MSGFLGSSRAKRIYRQAPDAIVCEDLPEQSPAGSVSARPIFAKAKSPPQWFFQARLRRQGGLLWIMGNERQTGRRQSGGDSTQPGRRPMIPPVFGDCQTSIAWLIHKRSILHGGHISLALSHKLPFPKMVIWAPQNGVESLDLGRRIGSVRGIIPGPDVNLKCGQRI